MSMPKLYAHYINEGITLVIDSDKGRVGIDARFENEAICAQIWKALDALPRLRIALVGLIGASTGPELRAMAGAIATLPGAAADKAAALAAIKILLETEGIV